MGGHMAELGVEATTMAIRELLMFYFKGTCVENLTDKGNLYMIAIPARADYNYQRREYKNQNPQMLVINEIPLLSVQKAPEKIVFNQRVFNRSPQLSEVYKGLKDFTDKYLAGVEVSHSRKGVFYA
jgi:hypothetical protein